MTASSEGLATVQTVSVQLTVNGRSWSGEVPVEQVLRHGARVDLIVVRLPQLRLLVVEVRPAGGS